VFFTSGSTGRPKGIVTSMFGNLTRARITLEAWRLGPTDRMLNTSSASTHSSFCRMLAAVCAGASLAHFTLATDGLTTLLRRLEAEEINILVATPGVLRALLSLPRFTHAARRLRLVLSAADALLATDIAQARAALPADCVIDHSYASTEAGIVSRWSVPDPPPEEARVPAGYPRDSLEFAFDPDETLIVRGRGVALGEWQAGTLVSGRMIADPTRPGWRVFNTGDRVRLGDDGLLRFVARADRQLNLNGVRIEPAEVETALRAEAGVTDATVIARAIEDRTVLVAFVASARPHEALIAGLRARVAQALPAAARPSRFIVLPEFPRLPSGKLDHPALLRLVDRL
jgi:acyl-coenzyme A synthetase/AMP-(fatty) acid ligase